MNTAKQEAEISEQTNDRKKRLTESSYKELTEYSNF